MQYSGLITLVDEHKSKSCFFNVVSLLGHVHATDGSKRECQDLKDLQTQLEKAFKLVPGSNVKCKPNSNCTGNCLMITIFPPSSYIFTLAKPWLYLEKLTY